MESRLPRRDRSQSVLFSARRRGAGTESSSTALLRTLCARARNCGPSRMTAGPDNWLAKRGSEASVVKILWDSASEALSTIAMGDVVGLPAAEGAAQICFARAERI